MSDVPVGEVPDGPIDHAQAQVSPHRGEHGVGNGVEQGVEALDDVGLGGDVVRTEAQRDEVQATVAAAGPAPVDHAGDGALVGQDVAGAEVKVNGVIPVQALRMLAAEVGDAAVQRAGAGAVVA